MIRIALPKGRNLEPVAAAFVAAGLPLDGLDDGSRRLWKRFPPPADAAVEERGLDVLLLKDRDLPLYVGRGVVDCGIVGRDVLDEMGDVWSDLLLPLELAGGTSRLSLIGRRSAAPPRAGDSLRLATKYPRTVERWLERQPWSAEILELSGSIELAPLVGLADVIVDIVQSGATLAAHDLVELETLREIRPCFVVHRGAWQSLRGEISAILRRLESAGAAA